MANAVTLPGERLAGLTADLFHKLQSGNLTLDEFALFNQRKNPFGQRKNPSGAVVKQLLRRLSITIAIPTITSFRASEHFVVDMSPEAKVKIYHLDEKFKINFLPKIESSKVVAEDLAINKLIEEKAFDPAIITALGGEAKVEITLGQFFAVIAKQPKGEEGPLLTYGPPNVGYIRNINGDLWAVCGQWCPEGWFLSAMPLSTGPCYWTAGCQFLSR